jgi:tetratricopeptide (TPR) repeat protein
MRAHRTLLVGPLFLLGLVFSGAVRAQGTAEEYFAQGYQYQTGEGAEKDQKKALAYYAQALKLNPELYPALYNSALIYHKQGEYAKAQNLFVKAARAARNLGENAALYEAMARNGLGTCYQKLDKLDPAEKQFDIARRMEPSLVEAHYNYINLLVQNERWDEAREALRLAEQVAPSETYEILKGRLKAREKRQGLGSVGGVMGLMVVILLLLLYSLFLRRRARQRG